MTVVVVVDRPEDWPLEVPNGEVVAARRYLLEPEYNQRRRLKVFNLCRSYRYQKLGYYVSLLATARGHTPLPSVGTLQDLRSPALVRLISDEVDELIQRSLQPLASDRFTLSIYFGRNVAKRYARLARELFNLFPAPLLRAELERRNGSWTLHSLRIIGARQIPDNHREFVVEAARDFFARGGRRIPPRTTTRYDLAILVDPAEADPPSDEVALRRFSRAAESLGLGVDLIGPDDYGRLAEYDALFIRQTTAVNHHTYRFSRRAAAEGLVVIDDPASIIRCTNKVFLAETLTRARLVTPATTVVHRDNLENAAAGLEYPCVLKLPDSAFSHGVTKINDRAAFLEQARAYLESSDLLIAQQFLPTDFDWRVGVLDGQLLYVCRYWMARGHWQIIQRSGHRRRYGRVEAVAADQAPPAVIEAGVAAARRIGDGLYGVDLKERDGRVYVIEINDNPNLDGGYEDAVEGEELWRRLAGVFLERLERRTGREESRP